MIPRSSSFSDLRAFSIPESDSEQNKIAVDQATAQGPLEKIKAVYARFEKLYDEKLPPTFRKRVIQVKDGVLKTGKFLSYMYKAFLDPLIELFRDTVLTGDGLIGPGKFGRFVKKTRVFSVITIPLSILGAVKGITGFATSAMQKDLGDVMEKSFDVACSLSDLCFSIGTFIEGLEAFGAFAATSAITTVTTYLFGVGTILSIAIIGLEAKFIYNGEQLKKRIKQAFGNKETPNFQAVVDVCDQVSDAKLAHRIGVADGRKLKAQLHTICERNANPVNNEKHKKNLITTVKALKTRIKWKTICSALKIAAAVISIVAMIVLLCIPPAAPAGYALLAIFTLIGIAVLVIDYAADRKLNNTLKSLAPDNSPEMWKLDGRKREKEKLEKDPLWNSWDPPQHQPKVEKEKKRFTPSATDSLFEECRKEEEEKRRARRYSLDLLLRNEGLSTQEASALELSHLWLKG